MTLAPDIDRPVSESGRCEHRLAHGVRGDYFVSRSGLDHERVAILARQQQHIVERDRRGSERGRHGNAPALVHDLTADRVQTREQTRVGQEIQITPVQDRRGDVRGALVVPPHDGR